MDFTIPVRSRHGDSGDGNKQHNGQQNHGTPHDGTSLTD
jgi:hypothetical protein